MQAGPEYLWREWPERIDCLITTYRPLTKREMAEGWLPVAMVILMSPYWALCGTCQR
jgi:hypothetical protein